VGLTVQIPDDVATSMSASGGDLSRRALEALALEEFKSGHITRPELRRLLGFATGHWTGSSRPMKSSQTTPSKTSKMNWLV